MQKIKNILLNQLKNSLIKNFSITFAETIITKGINLVNILLLTRILGPEDYGKYSLLFVSMIFLSGFLDFGMENTAVRFSVKEKSQKNSIFGLYFITKLCILVFITLVLACFGKSIFIAFNKTDLVQYIPFLIFGLIGESLFFVNDTYLQAMQQFKLRAAINISRYLISLMYISVLVFHKILLLKYIFFIYLIPLCFSVVFIFRYIDFIKSFIRNKINKPLFQDILNYEKWMFNLAIGNNVLTRIDFFMISFWVKYDQIGIYNAAFQLSSIVSFLPFILGKVMLPKMSELDASETFAYVRKSIKPLAFASLVIVCFIPVAAFFVPVLLGAEYKQSTLILQILLFAFVILLLTVPFEQALYSLGKPKLISLAKYIQIFVIIILNTLTIPRYGINWAAINVVITRIITLFILYCIYNKQENLFINKNGLSREDESLYGQT
ncbi:MAG: flippase [Candidatus Gastranaerophilales bacterium]|nr:flippase [Candidatus Gastranaerophilales bacterium]